MLQAALHVSRRPGVAVLLINAVLMFAGFFMLIPLVSVFGTRELGLTATAVGGVLAIRVLTQQGLTLFGGAIADHVGYKPILAAGILIRVVGFAMFAYVTDFLGLLLAAIIAALGGALFEATHKAALATLVPPRERALAFSLISTAGRVGTMLGPLAAVALLPIGFDAVSLAAAGCFLVAFVATVLFLPATRAEVHPSRPSMTGMLGTVFADRPFVIFTALTIGYWFLFSQLLLTLPLYIVQLSGRDSDVGWVLGVNSGFALVAQYPVIAWFSRRMRPLPIMTLGCGVMTAGLLGVAPAPSVVVLMAPILLYSLGDLLVQPTMAAITGDLARPEALGSYFGVGALGLAFGGGLGNALGGWMFDQALAVGSPGSIWLAYAALTALLAAGFYWYGRSMPAVRAHDHVVAPQQAEEIG